MLSTGKRCNIIFLLENSGILNGTLTSCIVEYGPGSVLYYTLLQRILSSWGLVCSLLIMLLVDLLSYRHVRPLIIVALCFLPPLKMKVTNFRESLLGTLDKLTLLLNVGSNYMASSHWFLFLILLVTVWYNLFIYLCS